MGYSLPGPLLGHSTKMGMDAVIESIFLAIIR
jgi:hypothetical protein